MKKSVFALQVFGLIAMLPLVAFLEMNHPAHSGNAHPTVVDKAPNNHSLLIERAVVELSRDTWAASLETYFSYKVW